MESAKDEFGVEPICATLTSAGVKIAPSTVYTARTRPPSPRARRDEVLKDEIRAVHAENYSAFGVRTMHVMLNRPEMVQVFFRSSGWENLGYAKEI